MSDVIVLDNREFLVAKRRVVNGDKYIYAIANDESGDFTLLKETEENGENFVASVTDNDEVEAVLKIIAKESI